ncbi:DUF732 domain-containing protein [Mycolicibacterium sp.]|uniref:DUF732 domain-containing protein n=1 Tax=Mycolicibacterium sp. TaxID=2320850 RepID=UPI0037C4F42B
MGRKLLVGVVGAVLELAAIILAAPSGADTAEDRQFLTTLKSIGWEIHDPTLLLSQAHMVCNEGLAHGVSIQEMRSQLTNWGYSSRDASTLIDSAIRVYCPKFAAIEDRPPLSLSYQAGVDSGFSMQHEALAHGGAPLTRSEAVTTCDMFMRNADKLPFLYWSGGRIPHSDLDTADYHDGCMAGIKDAGGG